jgi:hypothetical protein
MCKLRCSCFIFWPNYHSSTTSYFFVSHKSPAVTRSPIPSQGWRQTSWKKCWKIFAGRSHTAFLVEIDTHIDFLWSGERKRNCMVQDLLSMEGAAKRWPALMPVPLGQAQSNVQGHSNSQFFLHQNSGRLRRIELSRRRGISSLWCLFTVAPFWDDFHVNNSRRVGNSSSITLPFDLPCWSFQVANCCFIHLNCWTYFIEIWYGRLSQKLGSFTFQPWLHIKACFTQDHKRHGHVSHKPFHSVCWKSV